MLVNNVIEIWATNIIPMKRFRIVQSQRKTWALLPTRTLSDPFRKIIKDILYKRIGKFEKRRKNSVKKLLSSML